MSDLIKRIDKQVNRALSMLRDGDRAGYFLRGSGTFIGGQNTPVQIAFPVPADGDFYGDALSVFIEARTLRPSPGVSDKTFRSVDWTTTNDLLLQTGASLTTSVIGQVSGVFELLLPESYQNQATSIGALFSARHGHPSAGDDDQKQNFSVFPSKLELFTPAFVPRGTTVTFIFTPTYSLAPDPLVEDPGTQYEYRVSALFEGYKKVRSIFEVTT